MKPVLNDPPLANTGHIPHSSLEETLSCDVVTLHTPLTQDGPYPTYHLLNEQTFKWMKSTSIFINAARGEVVDTRALLDAITHKQIGPTIIDVWEQEPAINWSLFQVVTLGTPHIAGHSLDGKANGTFMIYTAICKHFDIEPKWNPIQSLPPSTVPVIEIKPNQQSTQEQIREVVNTIYDIEGDYHQMQKLLLTSADKRPTLFDALRKNYPVRREFHQSAVKLSPNKNRLRKILEGLGFVNITQEM